MNSILETVTGSLGEKRRWREAQARIKALPADYRAAAQAVERYLMHFGVVSKGDVLVQMTDDLASLFEQAAADATPIRSVVGEDPVGFAEDFLANYADGQWIAKERRRLVTAIDALAER
ncbi:DUF1048 domain-containing protein [Gulosibacter sp. 10]|uniref:DUF1048 domain-containing protein n=1 Tax=Gulosibacter sp. 10 TaxID=1255570 RepID=UPI00097EF11C|nr:DUF1048 domain-containing protein [Gulosibacter sp. 10]SJM68280.1 hypothetical protein FM112_13290 [Gulosibacter sp. 10]